MLRRNRFSCRRWPNQEPDAHGLVDGGVETFDAGSDEESVKTHLPGDGVGDHVTDHHPVAALLQAFQGVSHLSGVVHGEDVEVEVQQAAQGVGRLGDGGKPTMA